MSLNKTLDRLFDEIRREAKRNPDFANRLDAVLRVHESRRDVPDEVVEDVQSSLQSAGGGEPEAPVSSGSKAKKRNAVAALADTASQTPSINPAGLYKKDGEAALVAALASQELTALRVLVAEHNLDPSGVTSSLTRDELAAHILAQAKKRAERDEKMFDY
ncbi:MAG: hypothetical protein DCF16_06210 [Alphaproteobacteria bacterium]|nr:MAG: hypothetical protein DCF16_06210 [Alphaproteobacteria bacterium]